MWVTILAVYFVVWWMVLFAVLPFGVKNQVDTGEIVPGTEPGAPVHPFLWKRIIATTLVSAVVTALLLWGLSQPLIREYWK